MCPRPRARCADSNTVAAAAGSRRHATWGLAAVAGVAVAALWSGCIESGGRHGATSQEAPAGTDAGTGTGTGTDTDAGTDADTSTGTDADTGTGTGTGTGTDAGTDASTSGRRYRVAALGDSLTEERFGGGKYLAWLRARCPESRFESLGKGGDMTNQMRARFEADMGAATARLRGEAFTDLVVLGGVNDLYSDLTAKRTPEKIERDLGIVYAAARARGLRVVAVTVAPWAGFTRYYNPGRGRATLELNRWIRAQRGRSVDEVVDAYAALGACEGSGDPEAVDAPLCPAFATPDGLHWTPAGHQRLGAALHAAAFADCR
jgi:lysophospholipase L1-like esterase